LKTNEHYEVSYSKKTEYLHWPNLDDNEEFQKLDKRKEDLLESDQDQQYIDADDVQELKEQAVQSERKRWRRQIMKRLNERPELTQKAIADVFDMSAGRTNEIINE